MSYVLGMSFEYHRYHRPAVMRVFADNHLVHEIKLEKDINLKLLNWQKLPFPLTSTNGPTNWSRVQIFPEKLYLFDINEKFLKKSIRIKVINDNNNHTNGFMTENSTITFHYMFLIPSALLQFENWKKMILSRRDPFESDDSNKKTFIPKIFERFDFIVKDSNNQWSGGLYKHPRGGSFKLELPLEKKYGFIHVGKLERAKIVHVNPVPAKILASFNALNTYDENQRGNHT